MEARDLEDDVLTILEADEHDPADPFTPILDRRDPPPRQVNRYRFANQPLQIHGSPPRLFPLVYNLGGEMEALEIIDSSSAIISWVRASQPARVVNH